MNTADMTVAINVDTTSFASQLEVIGQALIEAAEKIRAAEHDDNPWRSNPPAPVTPRRDQP